MKNEQAIIRAHEEYIRKTLRRIKKGRFVNFTGILASAEGLRQLRSKRRPHS